jgi:tRNA(Ile)-lysidine synthase
MELSPTSAGSPSLPETVARDSFLESLAAAVPALGPGGFPVIVAVSGGADSVAMLIGLTKLGVSNLVVAHAEHDLRTEAHEDREFVGRLARRLGVPFQWRRLAVRERGNEAAGEGLEARARRLRYAFLTDVARDASARYVFVAHTADDQAETILHRILRGTGITGIAGMRRARALGDGIALMRPLLGISRTAGREFLRHAVEAWHEDVTNTDTTRARNFLRHEVLVRCVQGPYPAAVASLSRLGTQAAAIADALASAADHLLDLYATRQPDGAILLNIKPLASLDRHLLAELFVALWRREGWPQRDMTARHYEDLVVRIVSAVDRSATCLPGGVTAEFPAVDCLMVRPRRQ